MGYDPASKHTLFLLANGLILPRRIRFTLPASFTPFNWTAKEYHISQKLPPAAPIIPPSLNEVIQLPNVDPATAIQILTEQLPEALPHSTLESIRTPAPLTSIQSGSSENHSLSTFTLPQHSVGNILSVDNILPAADTTDTPAAESTTTTQPLTTPTAEVTSPSTRV